MLRTNRERRGDSSTEYSDYSDYKKRQKWPGMNNEKYQLWQSENINEKYQQMQDSQPPWMPKVAWMRSSDPNEDRKLQKRQLKAKERAIEKAKKTKALRLEAEMAKARRATKIQIDRDARRDAKWRAKYSGVSVGVSGGGSSSPLQPMPNGMSQSSFFTSPKEKRGGDWSAQPLGLSIRIPASSNAKTKGIIVGGNAKTIGGSWDYGVAGGGVLTKGETFTKGETLIEHSLEKDSSSSSKKAKGIGTGVVRINLDRRDPDRMK